jgi:hypothetical protein
MTVEIRLSGAAVALEMMVGEVLRSVGGVEPVRNDGAVEDGVERGDPIAVAALVLAIPGAIVATLDLMARTKVVERVQHLLEQVRKVDGGAVLRIDLQPPLDLSRASADDVMDRLGRR